MSKKKSKPLGTPDFEPPAVVENVIIPEVVEVKYPDFESLPMLKKVDIITTEIAQDCGDRSIEMLLEDLGVTETEYILATQGSNYNKIMADKSYNSQVSAKMPQVMRRMADDAINGDATAIKTVMQMSGKLTPETVVLHDQRLAHMDVKQLSNELKQLMIEAKELEDQEDGV